MALFADVTCILKVDVHCDSCKMKLAEVLSSVAGVYALSIDAKEGIAKVCGELEPNILVKALARTGRHAEIISVKMNHPGLTRTSPYPCGGSYHPSYRYGHGYLDGHYGYYPAMAMSPYYSMRRPMVEPPHCYPHSYPFARFCRYY